MGSSQPATDDRLSIVCRHLALVAIDGATAEVASTLADDFQLHVDGLEHDSSAYLALIAANHAAAHPRRPPLDVIDASVSGDVVTVLLDSDGVARFHLVDHTIDHIWLAWDELLWGLAHQRITNSRNANRTSGAEDDRT